MPPPDADAPLPKPGIQIVSEPLELRSIFKTLKRRSIPLTVEIPDTGEHYKTLVLDVDERIGNATIDAPRNEKFRRHLTVADEISVSASFDGAHIEFRATNLLAVQERDGWSLRFLFPEQVLRVQRRDAFRVDVPVTQPATCMFRYPNGKPGPVLEVHDISTGGLSALDKQRQLKAAVGDIFDGSELTLPDVGVVQIDLHIVRASSDTLPNGSFHRTIGCEFLKPDLGVQQRIQQYVDKVERRLNAKRLGYD
ncbi:MAG: flagellar brake protein [Burkholderiaceae bacterium]